MNRSFWTSSIRATFAADLVAALAAQAETHSPERGSADRSADAHAGR